MWRHFCVLSILIMCLGRASGEELTCVSCPDGLYLDQASFSCATCPANSRTPDPANASSVLECACLAGYMNGSEVCEECAFGTYKPALGNGTCDVCAARSNTTATGRVHVAECLCVPGFFLELNDCVPCYAGSSKDYVGNEKCTVCPPGTFCPRQSLRPVTCVANSVQEGTGKKKVQDCLCLPGFYTEDTVAGRSCESCPTGTYNEAVGSAVYGSTACVACPANSFNPHEASDTAAACQACDANARSLPGSSLAAACLCILGYSGEPGEPCEACAVGKFRSDATQYICAECPVDSYNAQLHMVSVESCLACPAPTSSDGQTGSGSLLACVCDPGYRAALGNDAGA